VRPEFVQPFLKLLGIGLVLGVFLIVLDKGGKGGILGEEIGILLPFLAKLLEFAHLQFGDG